MADMQGNTKTHTVTEGQTFYAISRLYQSEFPGITPEKIMADNGFDDPRTLSEGTDLRISLAEVAQEVAPRKAESAVPASRLGQEVLNQVQAAIAALPKAAPVAEKAEPSKDIEFTYKVPAGSSLWAISKKFDQPIADIAAANGLKADGSDLRAGANIKVIPGENSKHQASEIFVAVPAAREQAKAAVAGLDFNRGTKGSLVLTFDDGPNPAKVTHNGKRQSITEHILDELDAHGAKAIFFVNGTHLLAASEAKAGDSQLGADAAAMFTDGADRDKLLSSEGVRLLKEIDARGHTIATHTTFHYDQARLETNGSRHPNGRPKEILENAFEQLNAMPAADRQPFVAAFAKGLAIPEDQVKFEVGENWQAQYVVWTNTFTSELIREFTGQDAAMSRAPYGSLNDQVREVLGRIGKPHMGWDVDSEDWKMDSITYKQTAETTKDNILGNGLLREGAGRLDEPKVVLMHEREKTLKNVIDPVLDKLNERGYSLDTVPGQESETQHAAAKDGASR